MEIPKEESRPRPGKLKLLWSQLRSWWLDLPPQSQVRKAAGRGAAGVALILAAAVGATAKLGLGSTTLDLVAGGLLGVLFAVIIAVLGSLLLRTVEHLLTHSRRFFGWIGLGGLIVLFAVFDRLSLPTGTTVLGVLGLLLIHAFLAGLAALFRSGQWKSKTTFAKGVLATLLAVAIGGDIYLIWWLLSPGDGAHLRNYQVAYHEPLQSETSSATDPSLSGNHQVLKLSYGSGTDYRPEFGEEADLVTGSVDASPFVKGNEGWRMRIRHWHFGFDFEKFPINGRVWYPQGNGPFPLVLIVHGNHNMVERSDPGYAYLGEHLASRGFIFVSVDENFLNGSWIGGLDTENDGRGWMLLQHLKVWRDWNQQQGHVFSGKVDMSRIGLIGHSRGGEAAAIAGAFNRLPRYPDDATVVFDFNFGIRSIIAIAPSDGQYSPSDRPTPLKDVNYLVLQGGHDADVSSFAGSRQLRRVEFKEAEYRFKAAIFSYRSNHGQFNTVWGNTDSSWPRSMFLNLRPLLSGEEQRQLGRVSMTAFLEATLKDRKEYISFFRDHRTGSAWLPQDYYVTQFRDSTFRVLTDYEDDIDVATTTLEGGTIEGQGLAVWREEEMNYRRRGSKLNKAAFVGWRTDEERGEESDQEADPEEDESVGPPSYSILLPEGIVEEWNLTEKSLLVFSLADSGESPPENDDDSDEANGNSDSEDSDSSARPGQNEEGVDEEADRHEKPPLDLTIVLESDKGQQVAAALSKFRKLVPPLEARFTKLADESERYGKKWEPTLQTFEIPLAALLGEPVQFSPSSLRVIRFQFDLSPEGVLIIDEVGFSDPHH